MSFELTHLCSFLQWMPDSRGEKADKNDETEYPCIKCVARIDAPLEDVCTYLAEESAAPDYNDVVVKYKDLEEISPNAKICYSESPQILFVKPRDFITFCHHRWKGDGTEVIVNQATEHPDYPASYEEREGKACRAYALRGANCKSIVVAHDLDNIMPRLTFPFSYVEMSRRSREDDNHYSCACKPRRWDSAMGGKDCCERASAD
jgi:hypothetical protein